MNPHAPRICGHLHKTSSTSLLAMMGFSTLDAVHRSMDHMDRMHHAHATTFYPFTPFHMSTRCQIGFYPSKDEALTNITGWKALLYRHHDGYPSLALKDLIDFARAFHVERGMSDLEYCAARCLVSLICSHGSLLRYSCPDLILLSGCSVMAAHSEVFDQSLKTLQREMETNGYGISDSFHGDLDYFYAVTGDGYILAFKGCGAPEQMKHFFTVDINAVLKKEFSTSTLVKMATEVENILE